MDKLTLPPKQITKQEFGKRLYQLMLSRGWNQSELARQADLPRDSISTYVRGVAFPTPKSLKALAGALGVPMTEVLPNAIEPADDDELPSFEMKVPPSAPNTAWLRVNRLVSLSTATKIAQLIESDGVGTEPTTSNKE
jgi:transcriptional regulator with XRE-family HTH domain